MNIPARINIGRNPNAVITGAQELNVLVDFALPEKLNVNQAIALKFKHAGLMAPLGMKHCVQTGVSMVLVNQLRLRPKSRYLVPVDARQQLNV